MALVLLITRSDQPDVLKTVPVEKKLILGSSIYCDIVLEDRSVASMQCEVWPARSGHLLIKNLDSKKEVLLNQSRLKKAALKIEDTIKVGAFLMKIDSTQLTVEEIAVLNTEYEEFV